MHPPAQPGRPEGARVRPAPDLPATLVGAWSCWMVAAAALSIPESSLVALRTGTLPILYPIGMLALAAVTGIVVASLAALMRLVDRCLQRFGEGAWGAVGLARGALWGLAVAGVGVLVIEPWTVYDPYRVDWVLLGLGALAGLASARLLRAHRDGIVALALALAAVCAWTGDAFVQRHHFARLHDLAAWLTMATAALAAWTLWARWARPRWVRVLAIAGVSANAVALLDVRGMATTAVLHGVTQPRLLAAARAIADLDRDGFSPVLGGSDCDDLDATVAPGRCEIPGNVRDDNCNGLVDPEPPRAAAARWQPSAGPHRDVYVIVVDTLRADYGGIDRPAAFERLAAQSLDFTVAYTAYPSTYRGLVALAQGRSWRFVQPSRPTLASLLADAGWDVQLWHGPQRVHASAAPLADAPHTVALMEMDKAHKAEHTAALIDDALAELDHEGPPRMRWLHLDDPHYPWRRGDPSLSTIERYRLEIEHVSVQVGRLLDGLDASPRGRQAVIVLVGDHGEEHAEHGGTLHGGTLYEEVTRVPLLMRLPGVLARRVDDGIASTIDILPTLLHHLGLADPGGLQGVDWLGETAPTARVLSEIERRPGTWSVAHRATMQMVRAGRYKVVVDIDRDVVQLFDLSQDPGETASIAHAHPDVVDELLAVLARWQDGPGCRPPATTIDAR
jgi:arylsulfatase A-like enzyme